MPAEDDAREPRSCGRCGWLMLYTGRITPATPPRRAPEGHCVWSDRRGRP